MKKLYLLFLVQLIIIIVSCGTMFDVGNDINNVFDENPSFFEDFNGVSIDETIWQIATWTEHDGKTGQDRCYVEDGNLKMLFINDTTDGWLSSAIQTRDTYGYGRWEANLRPSNVPGILNSFYTIDWDDGNGSKEEIDIEFLTNSFGDNEGEVHYAVHESGLTSEQTNPDIDVDFDPSDNFHVWGFEITPTRITWFVDDVVLHTYTYTDGEISIDNSYQLKLNVWTSTGWVGGPPEADVVCTYLIDWIKFYPYVG